MAKLISHNYLEKKITQAKQRVTKLCKLRMCDKNERKKKLKTKT